MRHPPRSAPPADTRARRLATLALRGVHCRRVPELAPPLALWVRGPARLALWVRGPARLAQMCELAVAVAGARAATSYGAHVAGEVSAGLADCGFTVVSGAAIGIDGAAHRGALTVDGPTASGAGLRDRPGLPSGT
ncbi:MAG: DNA-processing protein DprA [Pseudonocardia sp.]